MSADNGVYILQTRGPEFRVAHLQAIDNVYYSWGYKEDGTIDGGDTDNQDIWIMNARQMWFGAPVFTDEDEAWKAAREIHDSVDFTEYGISKIEVDREFKVPGFNVEVFNPCKSFDSLQEAVLFMEQEDKEDEEFDEVDSIMFYLANGEKVMLVKQEDGKIILDRFEMGY